MDPRRPRLGQHHLLFELGDAPFAEDVDAFQFIRAPFLLPGFIKGLGGKANI